MSLSFWNFMICVHIANVLSVLFQQKYDSEEYVATLGYRSILKTIIKLCITIIFKSFYIFFYNSIIIFLYI